jgi:hypothetical protein
MSEEKKTDDIFIVMGHGTENVVDFEERTILPEGYVVVTFCECGDYTTLTKTCKLYPYFVDGSHSTRGLLSNPERLKQAYPDYFMHIYKPGSYIPSIKTTLKMVWNQFYREPKIPNRELHEGETEEQHKTIKYICKSGVFKYPLDESVLFDKSKDDMCNYSGWCANIIDDHEVSQYLSKAKEGGLNIQSGVFGITLEDIMKKFGPGIYYLPICRTATCGDNEQSQQKIRFTRSLSMSQQEYQEKGLLPRRVVTSFPLNKLDRARMVGRMNVLEELERNSRINETDRNELHELREKIKQDDLLRYSHKGKGKNKRKNKGKGTRKNNRKSIGKSLGNRNGKRKTQKNNKWKKYKKNRKY